MNLADRLRAALAEGDDIAVLPGDIVDDPVFPEAPPAAAAVLAAITDRAAPGLILTRRTDTLRRHAGQVAFPGGRADADDADAAATALREAWEEVALPADAVTVVGTLPPYRTVTGYLITPVVGVVAPDLPLVPAAAEVAAVFEVPFAFLLDPANRMTQAGEINGVARRYYEYQWREHRIWGATAAMIVNLGGRLGSTLGG